MRAFLNMLMFVALFVQLPFNALAAGSDLNHSHEQHQTFANSDASHQHDVQHSTSADDCTSTVDCTAHHHCTGTHLNLLLPSELQQPVAISRQSFGMRSETLLPSEAHTRIERPNWATL